MKEKFDQYMHEFIDDSDVTRFAVAKWHHEKGQYVYPLAKRSQELTGCYATFSKTAAGIGGYRTRRQALRRARYPFGGVK
jgi:hypothetical protein